MSFSAPIRDLADPRAQRIADLAKPSHSNTKVALVEDAEPLANAWRAGVELTGVYFEDGRALPGELARLGEDPAVPVAAVDGALLIRLFRTDKRPKVFGIAKLPRPAKLEALAGRTGDIVILDGVRIVGNIGAIIRTATGLGAAGVVLIDSGLTSVADRRLLRASRGYVFSLPVVLAQAVEVRQFAQAHQIGLTVLDSTGAGSLEDLRRQPGRRALVFGGERAGPSEWFLGGPGAGSQPVSIPMPGPVESLNVSVAVAIVLHARLVGRGAAAGPDCR
ncbi:MAG: NshR/TsnR family 23S rRNA methyltransferase [Bifidobacteriaceae bacterium]|nr:NshR/TsnR family 23S rRNA methyltransferase [Bifidobacteriaceae bacterium]